MPADPPVRADGRCARRGCHKLRKIPRSHHRAIDHALYELDPWCSTQCCRLYYGVPLVTVIGGNPEEKRGRHERVAA